MKASIDESTCTGCNACVDACPDVFEMGDDNIAKVKGDSVPEGAADACREAAAACPVTCITIEE